MKAKEYVRQLFLIMFVFIVTIFSTIYFFHDKFDNNALKNKEYLIRDFEPTLIFAGDSRAERQLEPIIASILLNIDINKVVNIAVSSGDALMIEDLINKYPEKFKDSTLIISISQNQLNDNSKQPGYFSFNMISKLSFIEQLTIFSTSNTETLFKYYRSNIFWYSKKLLNINKTSNKDFVDTNGFNGIDKKFDYNNYTIRDVKINPWYENYKNEEIKINILKKSLKNIKNNVKKLYVYTAPISPKHLDIIKNTNYFDIEIQMQSSFENLCNEININYKSYAFDERFKNEDFYDALHLNINGAKKFTKILLNDLNKSILD